MAVLGDFFAGSIVNFLCGLLGSRAAEDYHHGAVPGVLQLVEGPPGDGSEHAWLDGLMAAIWEVERGLTIDNVESLVLVVAMHLVTLPRCLITEHHSMHAIGVQSGRTAPWLRYIFVHVRNIKYIKYLNWHINTPNLERKVSDNYVLGQPRVRRKRTHLTTPPQFFERFVGAKA